MPRCLAWLVWKRLGEGIPPWPQALGESISDEGLPSWCTREVRGRSEASGVQGELVNGQRTLVVAFEPMQTRILNSYLQPCPGPSYPGDCSPVCTKQEHTGRLVHMLHSPTCGLATPAPVPILQLTDHQLSMFPSPQLPTHLLCPLPPLAHVIPYTHAPTLQPSVPPVSIQPDTCWPQQHLELYLSHLIPCLLSTGSVMEAWEMP